eukprot:4667931-Prymnesium_polylepis.1
MQSASGSPSATLRALGVKETESGSTIRHFIQRTKQRRRHASHGNLIAANAWVVSWSSPASPRYFRSVWHVFSVRSSLDDQSSRARRAG